MISIGGAESFRTNIEILSRDFYFIYHQISEVRHHSATNCVFMSII